MHSRRIAVFLLFALLSSVAWAETCKYTDSEGRVIYSNTPNNPPKGATKVKCFEDPSSRPAPTGVKNSDSNPANSETKAKLPRVSENTQKARDDERRRILEQEMADETQQLAQAKEQLAAQEAVRNGNERNYDRFLERVQPYRDAVATHERNIEAIKREIANLK
jgi:small-conductance mechanosensitive channel